jgi:hypothetical protein
MEIEWPVGERVENAKETTTTTTTTTTVRSLSEAKATKMAKLGHKV